MRIDAVHSKDVLVNINSDSYPAGIASGIMPMHLPFRGFQWTTSKSPFWHSVALRLLLCILGTRQSISFVILLTY